MVSFKGLGLFELTRPGKTVPDYRLLPARLLPQQVSKREWVCCQSGFGAVAAILRVPGCPPGTTIFNSCAGPGIPIRV
jgi:hypothetical protein